MLAEQINILQDNSKTKGSQNKNYNTETGFQLSTKSGIDVTSSLHVCHAKFWDVWAKGFQIVIFKIVALFYPVQNQVTIWSAKRKEMKNVDRTKLHN